VEREIARGLAEARLDAPRVCSAAAGVTIELASLTDGTHVNVFAERGFELLGSADLRGCVEDDDIEVARLIVREHELTAISEDRAVLAALIAHVEHSMSSLIAAAPQRRAA
jgi:hypothetical protein